MTHDISPQNDLIKNIKDSLKTQEISVLGDRAGKFGLEYGNLKNTKELNRLFVVIPLMKCPPKLGHKSKTLVHYEIA